MENDYENNSADDHLLEDYMQITLPLSNAIVYPDDSPTEYLWAGYETLRTPFRKDDPLNHTEVVYYYPSHAMNNLKNIANSFQEHCYRLSLNDLYIFIIAHASTRFMIEMSDKVEGLIGLGIKSEYRDKTYDRAKIRTILKELPFIIPEINKFNGVNQHKRYDQMAIDYALDYIINRIGYAALSDNSRTEQMLKIILDNKD